MNRSGNTVVIVPAYNESVSAAAVCNDLVDAGYQVVVVDDGSYDDTAAALHGLPVYLLKHEINLGQGAALQTGISFALTLNVDYFVTFDADGQHHSPDIIPMLQLLQEKQLAVIFGSRFLSDAVTNISVARKFILWVARYVNFLFTGLLLSDAHNGIRVFTREAATKIRLQENRMAHATEFLLEVKKHRLPYAEFPVTVKYTRYSKRKGQKLFHGFKILQDLILYKIFKR